MSQLGLFVSAAPVVAPDTEERWVPLSSCCEPPEAMDGYEVSSLGRVRSWKQRGGSVRQIGAAPRVLAGCVISDKRPAVMLCSMHEHRVTDRTASRRRLGSGWVTVVHVHRLVCWAFHGPRPSASHCVDHLDGDPFNNAASNLRWVTRAENVANKSWVNRLRDQRETS